MPAHRCESYDPATEPRCYRPLEYLVYWAAMQPHMATAARCCCAERQHFLTHLPPIRHRDLSSLGQQGNLMHARGLYLCLGQSMHVLLSYSWM